MEALHNFVSLLKSRKIPTVFSFYKDKFRILPIIFIILGDVSFILTISRAFIVIHCVILPQAFHKYNDKVVSLLSLFIFWALTYLACVCWNNLTSLSWNQLCSHSAAIWENLFFNLHWGSLNITFSFLHILYSFGFWIQIKPGFYENYKTSLSFYILQYSLHKIIVEFSREIFAFGTSSYFHVELQHS